MLIYYAKIEQFTENAYSFLFARLTFNKYSLYIFVRNRVDIIKKIFRAKLITACFPVFSLTVDGSHGKMHSSSLGIGVFSR